MLFSRRSRGHSGTKVRLQRPGLAQYNIGTSSLLEFSAVVVAIAMAVVVAVVVVMVVVMVAVSLTLAANTG